MLKKIAVIGGGPAGISFVYESLREKSCQWDIVGFEAKNELGGVWSGQPNCSRKSDADSISALDKLRSLPSDLDIPITAEELFQYGSPLTEGKSTVTSLKPLLGTSVENPLRLVRSKLLRDDIILSSETGLYSNFTSNVSGKLMEFDCSGSYSDCDVKSSSYPLIPLPEIKRKIKAYMDKRNIKSFYRLGTTVEFVDKISPTKWIVVAKETEKESKFDRWYCEIFDAVVIANGHFGIPYIPYYMSSLSEEAPEIHEFNVKFPSTLLHVRDIESWYQNSLPRIKEQSLAGKEQTVVLVGKSFSCMDVLKRLMPVKNACPSLRIVISSNFPAMPENELNPFSWFDKWLVETSNVQLTGAIKKFQNSSGPGLEFQDGYVVENPTSVIFCTGYLFSYPFLSKRLLESYRIFVTPDPQTTDGAPSNMSRVTGLYLHTLSIADPTLGFIGVSSNACFQSFTISSLVLIGAWTKFNDALSKNDDTGNSAHNVAWSQVLPAVEEELEWSRERLSKVGNTGAYHFYHPISSLKSEWVRYCKALVLDPCRLDKIWPNEPESLAQIALDKIEDLFYHLVNQVWHPQGNLNQGSHE
ncbi:LAMI_0H19636g1_1 [Lachancea mirantina]|uniref:LAMI_0H19636g1_1 n=1 Tax=Lachancea mirantina TaxID=1230905 RepID=A0A1G4KK23_9SACH|nr:LAMI_0H19636g1_1 [Lachancea mirantina]